MRTLLIIADNNNLQPRDLGFINDKDLIISFNMGQ